MKTVISTLVIALFALSSCVSSKVQEPEYREISNIRLVDMGILQSTAGIDFVYYNPNDFGVQLTEARGDVYLDDAYLGHFTLGESVKVKKRSEFTVPALLKIDMIGAIKNHRDIINKKEAIVRIEGIARVKKSGISKDVDIRYEGVQNIERFRTLVSTR
jgi:LEA14-like dessication related protein